MYCILFDYWLVQSYVSCVKKKTGSESALQNYEGASLISSHRVSENGNYSDIIISNYNIVGWVLTLMTFKRSLEYIYCI